MGSNESATQEPAESTFAPGDHWYVRRGAQVRGPFSSGKVRRFIDEGRLRLDDEVSQDKSGWRTARAVAEVVPLHLRQQTPLDDVEVDARRRDRRNAWLSVAIGGLLSVASAALVLSIDGDPDTVSADCTAPPAPGIIWAGCRLDGAAFAAADLAGADLANTTLVNADLGRANLAGANLRYANLTGADLAWAQLAGADLTGASLRGTDLTNADLTDARLEFADFGGAVIGGADFSRAQLVGAISVDGRECTAEAASTCP